MVSTSLSESFTVSNEVNASAIALSSLICSANLLIVETLSPTVFTLVPDLVSSDKKLSPI